MPKKPRLSVWTRGEQWLKRLSVAEKNRCCGNCRYYKRDYKCTKEPDAYITSTSERTDCQDWQFIEREPTYHRPL